MPNHRRNRHEHPAKPAASAPAGVPPEKSPERTLIEVQRSGDWMPVEDLKQAALASLGSNHDVMFSLDKIEHLDASALQILLALAMELKKRGQNAQIINASDPLRKWFEFAGATDVLLAHGATEQ